MNLDINEIARIIGADVIGDRSKLISGVSSFDDAGPEQITFACDSSFLARLDKTFAGAVIVPDSFEPENPVHCVLLKTRNPKLAFFKIVELFFPAIQPAPGVSSSAVIDKTCSLGQDVAIEALVVIKENVTIGNHVHIMPNVYIGEGTVIKDNTIIKPNVTIMERSSIGHDVIIHSGTVIGSDGFGFAQNCGTHEKLPHTGYVHIGNNVEIGACNTIDRGTLGTTHIGNGVKTDNQIHIAHNVKIGDNTLIVAQVGIAGSTCIGKNVIIAGKAGISGHLTIGDNCIVGPYAGVTSDVCENQVVSGIPHMPHKAWLKVANIISRLPGMRKSLLSFEKRLEKLESKEK